MKRVQALILALCLVGCIHEPVVRMPGALGAAPPTPAEVSACRTTRTWHNVWIILGTVFGGLAGAGGAGSALTKDAGVQIGIGIGVIASGIFASVATAAAGITADTFTTDNCPSILTQAAGHAP